MPLILGDNVFYGGYRPVLNSEDLRNPSPGSTALFLGGLRGYVPNSQGYDVEKVGRRVRILDVKNDCIYFYYADYPDPVGIDDIQVITEQQIVDPLRSPWILVKDRHLETLEQRLKQSAPELPVDAFDVDRLPAP